MVADPEAQIFVPVNATLSGHRRNEEMLEELGNVIVIMNRLTARLPELFT
jgi:hypothetical protein